MEAVSDGESVGFICFPSLVLCIIRGAIRDGTLDAEEQKWVHPSLTERGSEQQTLEQQAKRERVAQYQVQKAERIAAQRAKQHPPKDDNPNW